MYHDKLHHLGFGTVLASASLDWVATHGLSVLSAVGLVIGVACQLVTTSTRLIDWLESRKSKPRR